MSSRWVVGVCGLSLLAACEGRQSVLDPAGEDAARLAGLFWVMFPAAVVIWICLAALFIYVVRINPVAMKRGWAEALIVGGGILVPTVALAGLLSYSLPLMSLHRAPGDGLTIRVVGEQWWWRVEYWPEGAETPIISANEMRLPSDERVDLVLTSHEVIHSFWVPALGGKTDMFPGRETSMSLRALEPGVYRGQCTEFCGASHALMAFEVEVMEPAAFDAWLEHAASPAETPVDAAAERGQAVFQREGCGACHTVRGTPAVGEVGPDLTHVGARHSLGAGILPNDPEAFAHWVRDTGEIKPAVAMPAYDHLAETELADLSLYLEGLQ